MDNRIELTLLESFAYALGKQSRYNNSIAALIACDFAEDARNYLSAEDVNKFFEMPQAAKQRHAG